MRMIFLDAGPLGLVTNATASPSATQANQWLQQMFLSPNTTIVVPEITDYEVRRELIRAKKLRGLKSLDAIKKLSSITYAPITTEVMLRAAEYWAQARQQGKPTADNKALDGDMILCAQASLFAEAGHQVIVATTNVGHLALFVDAQEWHTIP